MKDNESPPTLTTKEITRRDLLQMTSLSAELENNDLLYLSNRGALDALMMSPANALELLERRSISLITQAIRERMEQDKLPVLTDRYIVILRAVDKLGNSRLTEIADEIEQYPSNVHRALQEMVDWDLVIREDSDEIRYSLTGLGVKSIQEF